MLVLRSGATYFFDNCVLFANGRYIGSGSGAGEFSGGELRCYGDGVYLRLVEDGYVRVDGDLIEVGLLRDYGGWVERREFDDGVLYIYGGNVGGNGMFSGHMPSGVVRTFDVFTLLFAVATATAGSTPSYLMKAVE